MTAQLGDLYAEVQTFYARQMRCVDEQRIEDFADTFTEDGIVIHATRGEKAEGRAAMIAGMKAQLPRYAGVVTRHFFDKLLIEPEGDTINVSYYTFVSRTDRAGKITFEPTFTVDDILVRVDGKLYSKSRKILRDVPSQKDVSGPVTFINRFTLTDTPENFEAAFAQTAEFFKAQPGLIDFTLSRTPNGEAYINIARWDNAESFGAALRQQEFAAHAAALRKVSVSEPALYEPRQVFTSAR